jgi:hypothetical protein
MLALGIAGARTWYVHPDSVIRTIQSGLDSCAAGDTVLVGPGTYPGGDSWPQVNDITVRSEFGPDSTIVDGDNGYGFALWFVDGRASLSGFAICNCGTAFMGGGVFASNCTLEVSDCVVWGNWSRGGGGMAFEYGRFTVRRCRVYENETVLYPPGGIDFGNNCLAMVESCTVANNLGGGIGFAYGESTIIRHCNIAGNHGLGVGYGGSPTWTADARYNWWGDPSGPYHATLNPAGLGDSVSDYVDFEPWLTAPTAIEESPKPQVTNPKRGATVVRSAVDITSSLNPSITALFDAAGRRTGAAKPGVLFLRERGASGQGAVRKVIITR